MNLIFYVIWCCLWWGSSAHKNSFMRLIGEGRPYSTASSRSLIIEDKWFEQKVDHFNPTDTRTWKQRYQMNSKYYKPGGPIFLKIGGEHQISHDWMDSGAWIEYAQKFNAMCFQLEHRYYGRSHPTDNLNTTNLMYLNVEQALADLGTFINNISNENDKILPNAKWVVFGGSYSGSLAAWLRMKYPHRVYAAVSSSSPLMAKIDFKEFFMALHDTLSNYNPKCALNIRKATLTIRELLKTNDGARYIDKKFKTCSNINENNRKERALLFNTLALSIGVIAQYNKDNSYNKNDFSLATLCDMMSDKSLGNPLKRYEIVHRKLRSINNQECLLTKYETALSAHMQTSWNAGVVKSGDRQWMYQVCTQMGNFITSNKRKYLFGNTIPLDYLTDMCRDVFGTIYNPKALSKAIKNTNKMYHDLKNKTSRVIYLHGSADAWNILGLTKPQAKDSISIFIKGVAHCADIYPSHSLDLPQLSNARKTVIYYLEKWLNEK